MSANVRHLLPRQPARLRTWRRLPTGEIVALRLLRPDDEAALGAYFAGLSAATRRVYAPHPFDAATARRLCAELDPTQNLRFVAVAGAPGAAPGVARSPGTPAAPRLVAYIIVRLGVGAGELARYAAAGLPLDPATTCCLAPSVADVYQSRGVGPVLMAPILRWLRELGYLRLVLSGGVRAENARAKRFYAKLGFRRVADFVTAGEVQNHDMVLDLV